MPLRVLVLWSCSNESTTDQVQDQVPAHLLLEDRQPPLVPHVREEGAPWRGLCYHLLLEDRQLPLVPHVREEGAPWRGLCYGATAAKSLQSCLTLRPQRWQPTRLPRPWDSAGKNTGVGFHVLLQCMKVKSESEVAQSCPTLSNPMDCSPPGSSVHGIFQARVLEWGAIAFSLIPI